jgi:hypothetical protein
VLKLEKAKQGIRPFELTKKCDDSMGKSISPSWRWLGLPLLFIALITGIIIATDTKTLQGSWTWAIVDHPTKPYQLDGEIPVLVPPWNASEESPPRGWVGFNVTLRQSGKNGYEVEGRILPADEDRQSRLAMRVVNETGLSILADFGFDDYSLNITQYYASTFLDGTIGKLHSDFGLIGMDTDKYIFLFRGLKNETEDRPIAVFLKETWLEGKTLLEPTAINIFLVAATATVGSILTILKPKTSGKLARGQKR